MSMTNSQIEIIEEYYNDGSIMEREIKDKKYNVVRWEHYRKNGSLSYIEKICENDSSVFTNYDGTGINIKSLEYCVLDHIIHIQPVD